MTTLDAHGISVAIPRGWDVYIGHPESDEIVVPGTHRGLIPRSGTTNPLVHLANFALPPQRGDYGQGATQLMRSQHIFIALLEHDREAADTALFQQQLEMPRVRGGDFARHRQVVALAGMAGTQKFFTHAGRPFCLYAVIGSWTARKPLAATVNEVLDGVEIEPR